MLTAVERRHRPHRRPRDSAPTTTCRSRSIRASCWRACAPLLRRAAAGRPRPTGRAAIAQSTAIRRLDARRRPPSARLARRYARRAVDRRVRPAARLPRAPAARADARPAARPRARAQPGAVRPQHRRAGEPLRRKIEVDPRAPRIIATVRGDGYMLATTGHARVKRFVPDSDRRLAHRRPGRRTGGLAGRDARGHTPTPGRRPMQCSRISGSRSAWPISCASSWLRRPPGAAPCSSPCAAAPCRPAGPGAAAPTGVDLDDLRANLFSQVMQAALWDVPVEDAARLLRAGAGRRGRDPRRPAERSLDQRGAPPRLDPRAARAGAAAACRAAARRRFMGQLRGAVRRRARVSFAPGSLLLLGLAALCIVGASAWAVRRLTASARDARARGRTPGRRRQRRAAARSAARASCGRLHVRSTRCSRGCSASSTTACR